MIGLYYFAFNGAGPVGGLLTGWLAASGGTEAAFAVSGVASLVMTAVAVTQLRRWSGRPVRIFRAGQLFAR